MAMTQRISVEEFADMPEVPGKRLELVDGEVVEMPGEGALHAIIVALLYRLLDDFAHKHNLGFALPDGLAYVLRRDPGQIRIPDVSFIDWDRVSVSIYRPDADTRELGPDAELDGGAILPGFSVRVCDLFEIRRRREK